jgi:MurNAc alpha-1-phosphate uridylyltransferase
VDRFTASGKLAHLWLVPNPPHNPRGDFGLSPDGLAMNQADEKHTFSTIALYRRALFEAPWCAIPAGNPQGLARPAGAVAARGDGRRPGQRRAVHRTAWTDVGTPERLAELNAA